MSDQLSLFGAGAAGATSCTSGLVEPLLTERDRELAARLPEFVRFGTSSWSFPGWKNILWKGTPNEQLLARAGLEAYAQQPLLRSVGVDRSYYGPLRSEDLREYDAQLDVARAKAPALAPLRVLTKVWEEISTAVYPSHPRYGARAGTRNERFLDSERCIAEVFAPYLEAARESTGPFVFELTPMPPGTFDERTLTTRVDDFLSRLPSTLEYAFELRNAELLGPRWLDMLHAHRAAHVFNFWTAMPSLREQFRIRPIGSPFAVMRLMQPRYSRYAVRAVELAPFDKIAQVEQDMRDDVLDILRAVADAGCRECHVIVGNKAEGSAPLTVRALAEQTATAFARR